MEPREPTDAPGRSDPARHGADEVTRNRARISKWAGMARSTGYGLWAVAIVAFFVGAAAGFSPSVVTLVVATLAVGSVLLAPAIVVGYGVKAAARDERDR